MCLRVDSLTFALFGKWLFRVYLHHSDIQSCWFALRARSLAPFTHCQFVWLLACLIVFLSFPPASWCWNFRRWYQLGVCVCCTHTVIVGLTHFFHSLWPLFFHSTIFDIYFIVSVCVFLLFSSICVLFHYSFLNYIPSHDFSPSFSCICFLLWISLHHQKKTT